MAAQQAKRNADTIRLVAVSKFHPAEAVLTAIQDQQHVFGENRIQEAVHKFTPILMNYPDTELHIIGPIQTNKLVQAVSIATTIQTLDRPALLDPLEKAIQKTGKAPRLLIQINTGKEPQKAGILPEQANHFIEQCLERFGSLIQGVMGIPPVHEDPVPHFKQLATFAHTYHLPEISMGMSSDFETAILYGATMVRVGSAIFGERPIQQP